MFGFGGAFNEAALYPVLGMNLSEGLIQAVIKAYFGKGPEGMLNFWALLGPIKFSSVV